MLVSGMVHDIHWQHFFMLGQATKKIPRMPVQNVENSKCWQPMHSWETWCFCWIPIGSMYDIFTYIWLIFMITVGRYAVTMDSMAFDFHWFQRGMIKSSRKISCESNWRLEDLDQELFQAPSEKRVTKQLPPGDMVDDEDFYEER